MFFTSIVYRLIKAQQNKQVEQQLKSIDGGNNDSNIDIFLIHSDSTQPFFQSYMLNFKNEKKIFCDQIFLKKNVLTPNTGSF